jgi:hypothetical protein
MRPSILLISSLLALLAPHTPADAQGTADGSGLAYGPHAVGFMAIEALDSTRSFRPARDFRGRSAGETARPVQISVWYPARPDPDAGPMRAGEFRLLRETELAFDRVLTPADVARLRAAFIRDVMGFGQDSAAAARTWDAATPAARGLPPLPGPYPTVLYFTAAGVSNPILPAYLASHGFVVASFPSNGRMTEVSLEFSPNDLTLDTDIDDAGFVHSLLRRLPYADTRRLAVASFSGGSLAALLWTMRDMQPAALVATEGWERYRRGAELAAGSVHFDPARVRVPFLMLERAADEASPSYAKVGDVVDALPYADITRVAFRDATHGDFLSHAAFGHSADQARIYAASVRMIRLFLEAALEDDEEAVRSLATLAAPPDDPFFTVTRDSALGPVPTEEELYRLAETDVDALSRAYATATAEVPGHALFREHVLTRAARFADTPAHRAAIMEIVVDAYPSSEEARIDLVRARVEAGHPDPRTYSFRWSRDGEWLPGRLTVLPGEPAAWGVVDLPGREGRSRLGLADIGTEDGLLAFRIGDPEGSMTVGDDGGGVLALEGGDAITLAGFRPVDEPDSTAVALMGVDPYEPGVLSTAEAEEFPSFTPSGDTLYVSRGFREVLRSIRGPHGWGPWEAVEFGSEYRDRAAEVSPDGRTLYLTSSRPAPGETRAPDNRNHDIWQLTRQSDGSWGEPERLPASVNTDSAEYHPSVTRGGTLYFSSWSRPDGLGRSDLYRATPEGDGYGPARNLGPVINWTGSDSDVFVDPDEAYILIVSTDRDDSYGGDDIYISYRTADGWTALENLGRPVNSFSYEYGPTVSPDRQWLYFTSHRRGSADLYRVPLRSALPDR